MNMNMNFIRNRERSAEGWWVVWRTTSSLPLL
jgi:hypothetical protein